MNTKELQQLRDKTFDYEDNQQHFVGSHFDAFFEDMQEEVMTQIPVMMDNSTVITSNYVGEEELPEDEGWQKGHILTSPSENLNEGLGIIVGIIEEEKSLQLISMFPHLDYGQNYELELLKVYVWSNGHEAQLEVDLGFTSLFFYDIYYDLNRKWYLRGNRYMFQILGIAYRARYRVEKEINIEMRPELLEAMESISKETVRTISLVGMSSFLGIDGWDKDDYSFSGIIQKVQEIDVSISNEKGWICTTRVLVEGSDENDKIYDMDILVTQKTWHETQAPKAGDDIEGSVWMQGKVVTQ